MQQVIGHEAIRRELRALAQSGDPPHAILVTGPESLGRRLLVQEFTLLLNCEADQDAAACGECRPCRLILGANHPDIATMAPGDSFCAGEGHDPHPDSRDIRICQVRGAIDVVARFPFEAKYRVITIEPADRLGIQPSNTLLKTLEEPPGHTIFILITAAPEVLLETIRSRCREVAVRIVPRLEIEQGLAVLGIDPGIAAAAATAARGRPGRAISFAEKPDLMADRGRILARCGEIAAAGLSERFSYAADLGERWRRDRNLVFSELEVWESFWEERLKDAAASESGVTAATEALDALRAISDAREDLEAQVMARAALELMILRFPTVTLTEMKEVSAHA